MRHFFHYRIPLYIYAGLIFILSSLSRPLPEIDIPSFDKVLHIFEYALFGFFACRAFRNFHKKEIYENFAIIAIAVTLFYGISDEFHQAFVPGRNFSVLDMAADSIGGIIGVVFYVTLKKRITNSTNLTNSTDTCLT